MNKPKLYTMVGLSASGKSTIAKELAEKENCVIVSSDAIRGEICTGGVADQSKNEEVFKIFHRRIRENLQAGNNVIADATNIKIKSRAAIFNAVKDINCEKIAYLMTKTYEDCIKDNVNREYPVPEEVIKRQMYSYQVVFKEEGFDQIIIHDNGKWLSYDFEWHLNTLMKDFDQKNPHHDKTLYDHCDITYNLFEDISDDKNYIYGRYFMGGFYHDVGKLFTQSFDEYGIAHYYSHENVGCYMLLSHINDCKECFYKDENILLDNLFLINYHMMPFNWNSEKAHNKWKRIFGDFKYQMLLDFHECDKARPNVNDASQK